MPRIFDILINPAKTLESALRQAKVSNAIVNFVLSILIISAITLPSYFRKIPAPLAFAVFALTLAAFFFLFFVVFIHAIAKILGAKGKKEFEKLVYAISIVVLPLSIFLTIFSFIGFLFLSAFFILYGMYIAIIAIEKCYRLELFRAIATTFFSSIAAIGLSFVLTNFFLSSFSIDIYEWVVRTVLLEQNPVVIYSFAKNELHIEIVNVKNKSASILIVGEKIFLNASLAPGEIRKFSFAIKCEEVFEDLIKVVRDGREITIPFIARC